MDLIAQVIAVLLLSSLVLVVAGIGCVVLVIHCRSKKAKRKEEMARMPGKFLEC